MPRQVHIEFEGFPYPVIDWANRLNRTVTSPVARDKALPLETLDECCVRSGFRIRRWLPTGNPSHLFVGTPSSNPVAGMARLQNPQRRRDLARHHQAQRRFGEPLPTGPH